MKKMLLLLIAALPMVFASCGDDEKETDPVNISLGISQFDVDYKGEYQLECNIAGATFSSNDPYIATVNPAGVVTGKHVGTTKIKATVDGYSVAVTVNVQPVNTDFTMPILSWGAAMNRIKGLVEENADMQPVELPADLAKTALAYNTNGNLPGYTYNFVDNKLTAATLTVSEKMDEENDLVGFLNQYYTMYGEDAATGALYLCDAEKVDDASVVLEYGYDYESETYMVIWRENSNTKTRATGMPEREDFDAFRAAARATAAGSRK